MNLGEKIREQRKSMGLTQQELADDAKIQVSKISCMENGTYIFGREKLDFVCDYLGVETTIYEKNEWHKKAQESGNKEKDEPATVKQVKKPEQEPVKKQVKQLQEVREEPKVDDNKSQLELENKMLRLHNDYLVKLNTLLREEVGI